MTGRAREGKDARAFRYVGDAVRRRLALQVPDEEAAPRSPQPQPVDQTATAPADAVTRAA